MRHHAATLFAVLGFVWTCTLPATARCEERDFFTLQLQPPVAAAADEQVPADAKTSSAGRSAGQQPAAAADQADAVDSADKAPAAASPSGNLPPLSSELEQLGQKIGTVLDYYFEYHALNTRDHSHWDAMHWMLPFGIHSELHQNGPGGPRVNAIAWVGSNRPCRGQTMFYVAGDRLYAKQGVGVQGHHGQLLAIFAQCRLDRNYVLKADGREFTVMDLVENEKLTCEPQTELTFKLIGIMYYCDSDTTWRARNGQNWSIPRLIDEEIRQPIRVFNVTCGGSHRLMGLSYAWRLREHRGEPIDGQWLRAKNFVEAYQKYAFSMQNPDGSLSTEWFRGPGNNPDPARKLRTTGHVAEWLAYSLSDADLRHEKMVRTMTFLTDLLDQGKRRRWEIGPLGHALTALAIYQRRVFNENQRFVPSITAARQSAADDSDDSDDSSAAVAAGSSADTARD